MGRLIHHSPLTIDLSTYPFAEEVSNEPPTLLLVIPSAAEGSLRIGLASRVGRDSSAALGMTSRVIGVVLKRFQQSDR